MPVIVLAMSVATSFIPQISVAESFVVQKLTGQGLMEIKITEPKTKKQVSETDPEKSLLDLKIDRKMRSLKNSKWASLLTKKNLRIAVIGDTGCRIKSGKNFSEFQDCNDKKVWPFAQVIASIQKEKPDLILHLGDFHYREQCGKGQVCEKMTPTVGYQWQPWKLDFFVPAKSALASTPWILARGNHEDCRRAYYGYNRTLATRDNFDLCTDYEGPDYIQVQDLLIVNLDTSAVQDAIDPSKESESRWLQRFAEINKEIENRQPATVWLVTHKPFYGFSKLGENLSITNVNLRKYLSKSPLLDKIDILFAGHIHVSQVIQPQRGPLQFIIGTGGSKLDTLDKELAANRLAEFEFKSAMTGSPGFGYAIFNRQGKNWNIEFKDEFGKVKNTYVHSR